MKTFEHFSLLKYNTFGINAIADCFVRLESSQDYQQLVESDMLKQSPFFILGGGSNVVLPDRYPGIIVHPANEGVRLLEDDGTTVLVEAQAGTSWALFVDYCIDHGWHGLENLASIPGSVGAAPVQNVGAYGREAKDVIQWVHYFDVTDGTEHTLAAADCQFSYRYSIFNMPGIGTGIPRLRFTHAVFPLPFRADTSSDFSIINENPADVYRQDSYPF